MSPYRNSSVALTETGFMKTSQYLLPENYRHERSGPSTSTVPAGATAASTCLWRGLHVLLFWLWWRRGWPPAVWSSTQVGPLCCDIKDTFQEQSEDNPKECGIENAAMFEYTADIEWYRWLLSTWTVPVMLEWKDAIMFCSTGGPLIFERTIDRPFLLTKWNALVISLKAMHRGSCRYLLFFWSWRNEKTMYWRFSSEAELWLWVDTFSQFLQAHQEDPSKEFADDAEEGETYVIVIVTCLAFVHVDGMILAFVMSCRTAPC